MTGGGDFAASLDGRRIVVLHAASPFSLRDGYLLGLLVERWAALGAAVTDAIDPEPPGDADVLLVHADRTVVPDSVIALVGGRSAVNGRALDIRKSRYLEHVVTGPDPDSGPVLVKTDLNHAGLPERLAGEGFPRTWPARLIRAVRRRLGLPVEIRTKADYRVYDRSEDVPARRFADGSLVQRFLPERRDGRYVLREYYFLGGREYLSVELGDEPILTSGTQVDSGPGTPPAEVRAIRDQLGLDYGKIDYGIVDGRAVIYDANKTLGLRSHPTPATYAIADHLAPGIIDFLS